MFTFKGASRIKCEKAREVSLYAFKMYTTPFGRESQADLRKSVGSPSYVPCCWLRYSPFCLFTPTSSGKSNSIVANQQTSTPTPTVTPNDRMAGTLVIISDP